MSHSANPGRAKSCTECRQVKLACDAKKTWPNACTRCVTRKLDCKRDASFRRVPTRKKFEEVSNELEALRAKVDSSQATARSRAFSVETRSPTTSWIPPTSRQNSTQAVSPQFAFMDDLPQWLCVDPKNETQPYFLEAVALEPESAVELLKHFERYYFREVPVMDKIESISEFMESSPLLFWSIMLVSAQWHDDLSYLYQQLLGPHHRLLSQILEDAIESVQVVQALLILSLWPVPRRTQSSDPRWNYINLAMSAASQMNIHQPLSKSEAFQWFSGWTNTDLSATKVAIKAAIWLALFHTNVQISTFLGLAPQQCAASQLRGIVVLCHASELNLPDALVAKTKIQRQVARYIVQLDGASGSTALQSLTAMFGEELENTKATHHLRWSKELEIDLQAAKLNLYATAIVALDAPAQSLDHIRAEQSCIVLLYHQGLAAASELISAFSELQRSYIPSDINAKRSSHEISGAKELLYLPKPYFTNLYFAATFMLKFLVAQPHASPLDREVAINQVSAAHRILSDFPNGRDHKRAALLIEIISRMTRSGGLGMDFDIKTRMGASFIYDASWKAAAFRHRDPETGFTAPLSTWKKMNDVTDLPPEPVRQPESIIRFNHTASSAQGSDSIEDIDAFMQMDQGWDWGLWDDQLFDSLARGTSFEATGI